MMAREDRDVAREDVADARDALDAKEAVDCKSGAFGLQDEAGGPGRCCAGRPDEAVGGAEVVAGERVDAVAALAGTDAFAVRFDEVDFLLVVSLRISARRPPYGLP